MSLQDRKRVKRIRDTVIRRDGLICVYCETELTNETLTLDHIVPASKHGTFNATNLTICCSPCNNERGNEDFFDFIKQFAFSDTKLRKYKALYFENLRIKVLNIAKEQYLLNDYAVPKDLIGEACDMLHIKPMNYDDLTSEVGLSMDAFYKRSEIIFAFERLIHLIEDRI